MSALETQGPDVETDVTRAEVGRPNLRMGMLHPGMWVGAREQTRRVANSTLQPAMAGMMSPPPRPSGLRVFLAALALSLVALLAPASALALPGVDVPTLPVDPGAVLPTVPDVGAALPDTP